VEQLAALPPLFRKNGTVTAGNSSPLNDGAAAILPKLVGRNRALEYLLTGETMSAAEAQRIGLINQVFPVETFPQQVDAFIGKLTANSKVILEMTKRTVDTGLYSGCLKAIDAAQEIYLNELIKTEDATEGLNAFLQKRPPVWKNR
jgi:cyclohexa-1,5-dienecarbonyl-CoA hydratase